MSGYLFFVLFSVAICSTESHHDTEYSPDRPTGTSYRDKHHNHDHSREHTNGQVEKAHLNWHSQNMTERSPRSTNANTKPNTESPYHHSELLSLNITPVPYPLLTAKARKIRKDVDSQMICRVNHKTHHTTRRIISRNCIYGLCEVVDDYPVEKVNRLVSRSKELRQYFEQMEVPVQIEIDNRLGYEGQSLCPTLRRTVFPQSAKNSNNVERILVNVGNYQQGIVLETCAREGNPCSYSEIFPTGYHTTCKQKYTVRRLMAVTTHSDTPAFDNFPMPSCCVCTVNR